MHLGIPEELGRAFGTLGVDGFEVFARAANSLSLFGAHLEVLIALFDVFGAVAYGNPSGADIVRRAAEPFAANALMTMGFEPMVQLLVHKDRAVITNGGFGENDVVGVLLGLDYRELLAHANLNVTRGVPNLEEALVVGVGVLVGVDRRMGIRALWEEILTTHRSLPYTGFQLLNYLQHLALLR